MNQQPPSPFVSNMEFAVGQIPVFDSEGKFIGSMDRPQNGCEHPWQGRIPDGECSSGCCEYYRCDACGERFMVELPD